MQVSLSISPTAKNPWPFKSCPHVLFKWPRVYAHSSASRRCSSILEKVSASDTCPPRVSYFTPVSLWFPAAPAQAFEGSTPVQPVCRPYLPGSLRFDCIPSPSEGAAWRIGSHQSGFPRSLGGQTLLHRSRRRTSLR